MSNVTANYCSDLNALNFSQVILALFALVAVAFAQGGYKGGDSYGHKEPAESSQNIKFEAYHAQPVIYSGKKY